MNVQKKLEDIALFRYQVLAPFLSDIEKGVDTKYSYFSAASLKTYKDHNGNDVQVSITTINRWYKAYRNGGFDALKPQRRLDLHKRRKIDSEVLEQIRYYKKEYPKIPATIIYQKLLDNQTIRKGEVSLSTINRCVNEIKVEFKEESNTTEKKRYQREHINEVWCGDSSVGPYLTVEGKKQRMYIIALIDDASRYIIGIDVFFNDNYVNLMKVIQSGVKKNGKPDIFNFDNGSNYKCKQMELLAARLGSNLHYCKPYEPTGKAKIERWFLTMKKHLFCLKWCIIYLRAI